MKCKTNSWVVILIVLLMTMIVGGGVYYWQNQEVIDGTVPQEKTVDEKEGEKVLLQTSDLKSYENSTLKIGFSYPQDWGDVAVNGDGGTGHIALTVFGLSVTESCLILAADNGDESPRPREGYWGDWAGAIDSQGYIDNFCNRAGNRIQDCEIKTNPLGVRYVKKISEMFQMGGTTSIETNYYIYNPNSEFRGVILSTECLRYKEVSDPEIKLQGLVDSIYFIK